MVSKARGEVLRTPGIAIPGVRNTFTPGLLYYAGKKPLPVAAAKRLADADLRAGEERPAWVLARDAAVLALLYGSGLRC